VSLALGIPLALVSGCLVFLSFPDFDLFPLQWFSLVPLLLAVRGRTFRGGLFLGFLCGLATNAGGFYWISNLVQEFGHLGAAASYGVMLLAAAYQGLTFAFATAISAFVTSRRPGIPWIAVFPFVFTIVEYGVPFVFPWYFANGQQRFFAATQMVELVGVSGLTFLLVAVNCALAALAGWRIFRIRPPFAWLGVVAALFVLDVGYGIVRIAQVDRAVEDAAKLKIGMVEANVGIWEKEAKRPDGSPMPIEDQVRMLYGNLLKHQTLSAELERDARPDLIVWPESSYIPLREVYSRTSDLVAVLSSGGGRVGFATAGGAAWGDEAPGASGLKVTGIHGLAAAHDALVLAVGPRGAVFRFDGKEWAREPTGSDRDLYAVAVEPFQGQAMAVGSQGTALIRDGGTWKPVELGTHSDLRAVTYAGGGSWVAVGDGGVARVWDDRGARGIPTGTDADLLAVSVAHGAGAVIVGRGGTVVRLDASGPKVETPVRSALRGVAAGSRVSWIVGDDGTVLSCAETCRAVKSGTTHSLFAVSGDGGDRAWAAGAHGTLLALSPRGVESLKVPAPASAAAPPDLRALAWIPFREGYPLPADVRHLYVSPEPLPAVDLADPSAGVTADQSLPERERNAAIRGFSTPVLFGVITYRDRPDFAGERDDFNTAILVDQGGKVLGRYDKNYLLIFGEYVPFADWFPFVKNWIPEAGDFRPGTTVSAFPFKDFRIGVLICYEDIIPSFTRKLAGLEPNVLINVTNDAWFGKTSEPDLHLQLATFRAIENRLFLLRSTNTGVSAVIDPVGRVLQGTDLDNPETIVADVAMLPGGSLYRLIGDAFAWACGATALAFVIAAIARGKGKKGRGRGR
jgi:apolipoprotein N-acyltransferase